MAARTCSSSHSPLRLGGTQVLGFCRLEGDSQQLEPWHDISEGPSKGHLQSGRDPASFFRRNSHSQFDPIGATAMGSVEKRAMVSASRVFAPVIDMPPMSTH